MTDVDKLRTLLPHWIEHNEEHGAEFRKWSERIRAMGRDKVADQLDAAIDNIEEADRCLQAASRLLDDPDAAIEG